MSHSGDFTAGHLYLSLREELMLLSRLLSSSSPSSEKEEAFSRKMHSFGEGVRGSSQIPMDELVAMESPEELLLPFWGGGAVEGGASSSDFVSTSSRFFSKLGLLKSESCCSVVAWLPGWAAAFRLICMSWLSACWVIRSGWGSSSSSWPCGNEQTPIRMITDLRQSAQSFRHSRDTITQPPSVWLEHS